MSGRLLTFSQYLGGADNVKVIEMFPSTSKTFKYDFGTDITGWTWDSHYQTLLLDKVTYDRNTGEPNFTDTNILGYWPEKTDQFGNPILGGPGDVQEDDRVNGTVFYTIAPDRYTGQLFPNARENVVMTVASMSWIMPNSGNSSGFDTESHRWGIIERYLPGDHVPGDPALDPGFVPYGVGAVIQVTVTYTADPTPNPDFIYDQQFRFTDNDASSPYSNGTGFSIGLKWTQGVPVPDWGIINAGRGYRSGDFIIVSDEALGNGGSGETRIDINLIS